MWPQWLNACYHLTPHLQRFGSDTALLDLGICTDAEALAVVQALIARLERRQVTLRLRAAIAPTGLLAQLALLHASTASTAQESLTLTLLTAEQTPALLRETPITALTHLQFADQTGFSPKTLVQVVARLDGYGVRSLAQLARFEAAYLHRQFGTRLGDLLLAVARGKDVLPFQPTPAPLRLHFRLRLTAPLATERLVAALKPFTLEVASVLARRGLQAYMLELRLRFESGHTERISQTLPQPVVGGRALHETVQRLLQPVVHGHAGQEGQAGQAGCAGVDCVDDMDSMDDIEDVRLMVSHLVPLYPAQPAFWRQCARRMAAVHDLADVLIHRYGKPLLFKHMLTAPDAIFDQDRSRLTRFGSDITEMAHGAHGSSTADVADVLEGQERGVARPVADVADVTGDANTADAVDTSAAIQQQQFSMVSIGGDPCQGSVMFFRTFP